MITQATLAKTHEFNGEDQGRCQSRRVSGSRTRGSANLFTLKRWTRSRSDPGGSRTRATVNLYFPSGSPHLGWHGLPLPGWSSWTSGTGWGVSGLEASRECRARGPRGCRSSGPPSASAGGRSADPSVDACSAWRLGSQKLSLRQGTFKKLSSTSVGPF